MKSQKGFTLIEVMITIMILGTLTVLTAQAIQAAIKNKIKIQDQIDDVSRMRDAVRLMERDINLAYHYRDVEKEIQQLIKKSGQPQTQTPVQPPGQPGGFNPGPGFGGPPRTQDQDQEEQREVPRQDPQTHFVGNAESMNFVTLNNARTVRNSVQADFVEIGYTLRECRSLTEGQGTSKCIWRRSTPFVDLDVTKGGDEVVLLENVSEFKMRYIGKGKQDWVTDWRTDEAGDGATKGKFPQAVEISLTVEKEKDKKKKKFSMQVVVPIHFPNNPEESTNANQGSQNAWPQPSGPTK
ncbi:Pseudopilin GspJ [compost metagenome]